MKLIFAVLACIAYTEAVKCKRGTECPEKETCCPLPLGQEGCCPLPNAVCCSDHQHCCPEGFTCDAAHGTCIKQVTKSTPLVQRRSLSAQQATTKEQTITCVDGNTCPDGDTCCNTTTVIHSDFGCCPMPSAVCCNDNRHCCPTGYNCVMSNTSYGQCIIQITETVPMMIKIYAKDKMKTEKVTPLDSGSSIVCQDGKTSCQNESQTCCQIPNGESGCCPMPDAFCCKDLEHCCPEGFECIPGGKGLCTAKVASIPMVLKQSSQKIVKSVICPDKTSSCPDGTTCCKLSTGQYGCCPFPNADCCNDHLHCCPNGYTCDLSKGTCNKGACTFPLATKGPSLNVADRVLCPDARSQCPADNTCCKLPGGSYGCCPMKNADCCSDHLHCCPSGYTCDISAGTCTKEVQHPLIRLIQKGGN